MHYFMSSIGVYFGTCMTHVSSEHLDTYTNAVVWMQEDVLTNIFQTPSYI